MLIEKSVKEYADLMSSDYGALGGGGASALSGSIGSALTAMVGTLTIGRKKYAEDQELAENTAKVGNAIKDNFLSVMERDTAAFDAVSAVFAMPKNTEEEKAARAAAMQSALKGCTETPLEMMQLCVEALELAQGLLGHSNQSAASDLGCAALQLGASVRGAWLNVLINLDGIKDADFAADRRAKGEALLTKAQNLADEVYQAILTSLL